MDFSLSTEQQMVIDSLRKYLDNELEPEFRAHGEGHIAREQMQAWTQALTEFGMIKAPTLRSGAGSPWTGLPI